MEVKAVGKPKPEGKWLKDGDEIKPSKEFVIENFDDGTSVLTISEVYPDDTGEFVYEAYNPLGVAITTTLLSVEGIVLWKLPSFSRNKIFNFAAAYPKKPP